MMITLGEALEQTQQQGHKTHTRAEQIILGQAADYLDEQAEQILTPVNSRSRKILQDMAIVIRLVSTRHGYTSDTINDVMLASLSRIANNFEDSVEAKIAAETLEALGLRPQSSISGPCSYCGHPDHWRPDCPVIAKENRERLSPQ